MVVLYEHPLSPYAQKVKIALQEKGIPFETRVPNFFGRQGNEEFMASSPRLEVPSLVDGEACVFDSTIILEYIEDRWPQPSLLPSAPAERARVRMLEELCDTYFEAINWAIAEIRAFGRAEGEPAARLLARAEEQIGGMYGYLERQLGSRPFFNGEHFGWGDLSVYPYVAGSVGHGFSPPPASGLASWLEQVGKRESIRTCSAAAQEAMAGFQNLKPLVEQRLLIREYRDHRLEWMMRSGGAQIVADGMANGNIRFSVEIE